MPQPRSFVFDRYPRFAARHPWRVLAGALAIVVILGFAASRFGGSYVDTFSVPNTEAQRAIELLQARFPSQAGDSSTTVVVRAPAGLTTPQVRAQVDQLMAELKKLPEVVGLASPYTQPDAISKDGTIARIGLLYDKKAQSVQTSSIKALAALRAQVSKPGFQVEVGGQLIRHVEMGGLGNTELIGVGAAVIILLIAFGSVVAMGLPIVSALLALGAGLLGITIMARFVSLPSFTSQFGAMIGLGVGIDYALLTVTRFREGLAEKLSIEDAIAQAGATAGRSVLFAGATVVIAMLGLWAVGLPFVSWLGTSAAIIVALSVGVTLFVQPAILRLVGHNIDRWRLPFLAAPSQATEAGFGYRWSRVIQRAPVPALVLSLGALVVMAVPLLSLRLGSSDAGNNPTAYTSRRTYDLLSQGFGPGFNGPILLAVQVDTPGDASTLARVNALPAAIKQIAGVADASPPRFNAAKTAAIISVTPTTAPQSRATNALVHRLRTDLAPTLRGSGATVLVGGATAAFIDIGDRIASRLPLFFGAVIGLSFLLLMAVFRSVLVPLKAALMNLLAIGAAYGVLVAVFQWGWFGGVIGVHPGPIESFLPMFLFAILFGLSMDYEVFLVSRIREEYLLSRDASASVARGLSLTTRLITAAAAIMVSVFASFAFGDNRVIKEFGIGLAAAIFVDATLVRLVLVPAFMQVAGDWNWWFPGWLDRVVPRISVEGHHLLPPPARRPEPVPVRHRD
ncbi:MAG: MMPL family transporter [Dehalococcoidia bacterium]